MVMMLVPFPMNSIQSVVHKKEIDVTRVGETFTKKCLDMLGASKTESFEGTAILTPEVAANLFGLIIFSVTATNIQAGLLSIISMYMMMVLLRTKLVVVVSIEKVHHTKNSQLLTKAPLQEFFMIALLLTKKSLRAQVTQEDPLGIYPLSVHQTSLLNQELNP